MTQEIANSGAYTEEDMEMTQQEIHEALMAKVNAGDHDYRRDLDAINEGWEAGEDTESSFLFQSLLEELGIVDSEDDENWDEDAYLTLFDEVADLLEKLKN